MRTRLHLLAVAALAASTLLSSCSTAPMLKAQISLAKFGEKFEEKTEVSPTQAVGLLGKWWADYNATRQANEILRTKASPAAGADQDFTSAKAVLESLAEPAPPPASGRGSPQARLSAPTRTTTSPASCPAASSHTPGAGDVASCQALAVRGREAGSTTAAAAASRWVKATASSASRLALTSTSPAAHTPVFVAASLDAGLASVGARPHPAPRNKAAPARSPRTDSSPWPPGDRRNQKACVLTC